MERHIHFPLGKAIPYTIARVFLNPVMIQLLEATFVGYRAIVANVSNKLL